jgi:ssDNA-binding Zn-finger/Zn-ribbon topoisomerase 1
MEYQSDTNIKTEQTLAEELIQQISPELLNNRKEFKKTLKALKQLFNETKPKPETPVDVEQSDQPKRSMRGRPKQEDHVKKVFPKEYFQNYYHQRLKQENQCDHCGRYTTKANMTRHKKSSFCINFAG